MRIQHFSRGTRTLSAWAAVSLAAVHALVHVTLPFVDVFLHLAFIGSTIHALRPR